MSSYPTTRILMMAAALWTLPSAGAGTQPSAYRLDPDRVGWESLRFEAKKLMFKAHAEVGFATLPRARAATELAKLGDDALMPQSDTIACITLRSRLGKRRSTADAFFDAADGRALERRKREHGRKSYRRIDRFTAGGVVSDRRVPGDGERELDPERWSEREEHRVPWTAQTVAGRVVTEPSAIFYLITSPALAAPGDRLEALVYSSWQLDRLHIEVVGTTPIEVAYDEKRGGTTERRERTLDALEIAIRAEPLEPGDKANFDFLGLEGDVTVLVDPDTRLPLEVHGRIPIFGKTRVTLHQVTWKDGS